MSNIKYLQCFKYLKKPINTQIIFKQSTSSFLINNKTITTNTTNTINTINNNNKLFYSTFNRFSKGNGINNIKSTTNTSATTTTIKNKDENELYNFNLVNPDTIKPFKARHFPYETTTNLDFLVPPGHIAIESKETLEKYLKLAKALSAVGYEHQENERWEEAIESYNKALFYIRNVFASEKYRSKIDLRDFAVLLSNSAESFSRTDKTDEAMIRSQQAIDLLEVYWRNYVQQQVGRPSSKKLWLKDEMLGIFYNNYSEYLIEESRYQEAEPYLMRAHEILEKIYPLGHPINIEIGVALVKVLNEMGRSKEVEQVFTKYGDLITDAMGKTEEFKHISEKVETDIKFQMIEQIKEQYPELELDHKDFEDDEDHQEDNNYKKDKETLNNYLNNNENEIIEYDKNGELVIKSKKEEQQEDEEEDDEDFKYKYKEPEFNLNDLLLLEQDQFEKNEKELEFRKKQQQQQQQQDNQLIKIDDDEQGLFKERDFDELEEGDELLDDEDDDFDDHGDEDEGDREDLGADDRELHPREEMLNLKLEQEEELLKQRGEKVFSNKIPLGKVLNDFDSLFDEATSKYSDIQAERIIDREERLINKHSGIPEKVIWQDGKIITPTDERGEPISQGAIDKWGKYYAEDLIEHDKEEEEEVLDEYIDKMETLMNSMSKQDSKVLDREFNQLFPKFKKMLSQPNPERFLNTSLMDFEEDENNEKQLLLQELKLLKERYQELDEMGIKTEDQSIDEEDDSYFDYDDYLNDIDRDDEDDDEINDLINLNKKSSSSSSSTSKAVTEKNLIDFMDTAKELNFDQDKILKKMGEKEFEKLQNHFEIDDDDLDENEKQQDLLLNNLFNKKSKKQNQLQQQEQQQDEDNTDDLSLNDLLKQLEELDENENEINNKHQEEDDDETIDLGEFDELDEFDDDQLLNQDNPEEDLEKYLKKVSKSDTFKEFINDINNKKK